MLLISTRLLSDKIVQSFLFCPQDKLKIKQEEIKCNYFNTHNYLDLGSKKNPDCFYKIEDS
jgi:hypothetical protein